MKAIKWNGETITEPGIYTGISLDDYHNKLDLLDAPSVSKSNLKHLFPSLGGSPKKFWHLWKHNPNHIEIEPTDALEMGKAVHALLLGDEVFDEKFSVRPERFKDYKTKAAKEWRDAVRAEGKTPITLEQVQKITLMAEDASKDPMVRQGILNGKIERSVFIKDEKSGLWFRSRIDNLAADGFFADLKTTSSMDARFIQKQIRDNGYFLQAGGAKLCAFDLGFHFNSFWNVYVCTGDTPDTQAIELDPADIDLGQACIRQGLNTIAECMKSGIWPGARPCEGHTARIDDWSRARIEEDLKTPALEQAA